MKNVTLHVWWDWKETVLCKFLSLGVQMGIIFLMAPSTVSCAFTSVDKHKTHFLFKN